MGLEIPSLMAQTAQGGYAPLKDLFLFFRNKANYVKNLEDNLMQLTAEVTTFYSKKENITRTLATHGTKEETDEYKILLKQIDVFSKRYVKFVTKYGRVCKNLPSPTQELDASVASTMINVLQQVKPTILKRKFLTLAKLSKHVKKLHVQVSEVNGKMILENAMVEKKPELVQTKLDDDIDLPSMTECVDKVLSYLCEDENKSVGIVGVIGVGKTTVMKKLNNRLQDISTDTEGTMRKLNSVFVIWIDYPTDTNEEDKIVEMMQDAIMRRFKLNRVEGISLEQNAINISTFLCQKKYIVLFDQVSSTINLSKLGIRPEKHKFGKIVVASSNNRVIDHMTNKKVEICPLPMEDARTLFKDVCKVTIDGTIKFTAERIIDSCGGLPSVIKLVATHLQREENEDVWRNVKRKLQAETNPPLLNLGAIGNAYKMLYDGLKEPYLKKCLLFGALFPCHHKIYTDYLVECWTAESFLPLSDTDVPKLRRAREHGASVLRELTDKYLFEQCSYKYVKMPVYFRKVALELDYPDEHNGVILVPEGNGHRNPENWKRATRMSLVCGESEIPENPESSNISTLLLQWNPELVKLGELFFCNMQKLQVLDLNKTGIESLPSSFSSLVNLISLYLNDCSRLAKLPAEIRLLGKLEFLDIRGTAIPFLPCEIGDMIYLRCLRITFSQKGCHRIRKGKEVELMTPHNVICRLQLLEELTIETGCCSQSWNNIADELANELICLEKLTTLSFHFPSVRSLENFVSNSKSWKNQDMGRDNDTFRSFKFSVGCCDTQHPYGSSVCGLLAERHLTFSSNEEVSCVKEALKQASAFELIGHSSVKTLSDFGLENIEVLKVCVVERCMNLASMVDADGITQNTNVCILQFLEKLHLFDLQLLECVWKGSTFPENSFSKMKVLTLHGCPKLTHILDHKLAKAFSSLKHLKVEKCSNITEIVKVPDQHNIFEHVDASDILHKLKTVELVNLPELQKICKNAVVKLNSLREIVVKNCNKFRDFSVGNEGELGKLKAIKCEDSWWSGVLQWPDEQKRLFFPLCDFIAMDSQSSNVNGESSSSSLETRNGDGGHK